jgi:hypothetical protein
MIVVVCFRSSYRRRYLPVYLSAFARQVKQRLDLKVTDLGAMQLKNIAEPVHVYSLEVGQPAEAKPASAANAAVKPESLGVDVEMVLALACVRRHHRPFSSWPPAARSCSAGA